MESSGCGSRGKTFFDYPFATSRKQSKGASLGVNAPPQIRHPRMPQVTTKTLQTCPALLDVLEKYMREAK
jgi:hypothetical protein